MITQDSGTLIPLSQLAMSKIHRSRFSGVSSFIIKSSSARAGKRTIIENRTFHMSHMEPVTFIITLQWPSNFHPSTSQSTILHIINIFCHSFSVESFLLSLSSEDAKSNFLTVCYWFNGNYIFTKHQHTHIHTGTGTVAKHFNFWKMLKNTLDNTNYFKYTHNKNTKAHIFSNSYITIFIFRVRGSFIILASK